MNCESFQRLLDEIPLTRWSEHHQYSAEQHCKSCERCEQLWVEERQLFAEFAQLIPIEPTRKIDVPIAIETQREPSLSSGSYVSAIALGVFLIGGINRLVFSEEWSFNWLVLPDRIGSTLSQFDNSPVMFFSIIIAALVYCFDASSTPLSGYSNSKNSSES